MFEFDHSRPIPEVIDATPDETATLGNLAVHEFLDGSDAIETPEADHTDGQLADINNTAPVQSLRIRYAELDEQALITLAQAGDPKAFEEMVKATYQDVYALAYRLSGSKDQAEDITQETYTRAFRAIGNFRGDAQLSTWLFRITVNCSNTYIAKRQRRRTREESYDEYHENHEAFVDRKAVDSPEHVLGREQQAALVEELRKLPPKLRTVVVLRDVYDQSHTQIAEELGISESAAKVRLHRARKKLKEALLNKQDDQVDL